MNFASKLRALRLRNGLSQERMADLLNVSRQAGTKWETGRGLPDIANLATIASLFGVSFDDLLSVDELPSCDAAPRFRSSVESDVIRPSHFDVRLPGCLELVVRTSSQEKLRVELSSPTLVDIERAYKVRIDESRNRLDVYVQRQPGVLDIDGQRALRIEVTLPASMCEEVEVSAITHVLRIIGLEAPVEYDGKASDVWLSGSNGAVTINCSTGMEIRAEQLPRLLEVNQVHASSGLHLAAPAVFEVEAKGSNKVTVDQACHLTHDSADGCAPSLVRVAGMNSELVIDCIGQS